MLEYGSHRLIGSTKPKKVVVCMIYYLDVHGRGSWADCFLSLMGYNIAPQRLQATQSSSVSRQLLDRTRAGVAQTPMKSLSMLESMWDACRLLPCAGSYQTRL